MGTKGKVRGWRVDVSLVCFVLVLAAAIPVALLRTRTYALGYELGHLKAQERALRQENAELLSELATVERSVRDKHIAGGRGAVEPLPMLLQGNKGQAAREPKGDASRRDLVLPNAYGVIHGKGVADVN